METSRDGFKMAMEISAYSLIAVANAAKDLMSSRSAIAAMTYFGGEKCVPGYNVMGSLQGGAGCDRALPGLRSGPRGIRVNALSAGPLKTLAGSAAGVGDMLGLYAHMAPLGRNITHEEVGKTGAFLLSDHSDGITGEILHIDGGYNAMGSPGRLARRDSRGIASRTWCRVHYRYASTKAPHDPMSSFTSVAIAVVEHENQFLVGRRAQHVPLGGLWEFPGGKLEGDESPRAGGRA